MTVDAGSPHESPATQALRAVTADPHRARRLALAARLSARRAADRAAESTAERALGLVARELQDAPAALRHLRRAVRIADRSRLPLPAAEARMSLALVLAEAGRPVRALREIDVAAPALDGLPAARLHTQRALILDRLGRFAEAMAGYTGALAIFRRIGDPLWQARTLTNRGVLHAYRGNLRHAEADLVAAADTYRELGQELALAQVRHNLGFVASRAGDIPGALRWYDLADQHFTVHGPSAIALMDRGELLLRARLLPESRAAAEAALHAARAGRMGLFQAQARLMLAEVATAEADWPVARRYAVAARRSFVRQGRVAWAALARYVALRARQDRHAARHLREARAVAAELARTGWLVPALDARLYAASLATGQAAGKDELRRILEVGRRGPAELRVRAWHAAALLREALGDLAGARRALLAGTRVLDDYRAALGATELRTLATGFATDLAATGLRLALRTGRARSVLWWAERWKAASLRLVPARPPDEAVLAADLAELRRTIAEADTEVSPHRAAALWREQRLLEERIRQRSWQARGDGTGPHPGALIPGLLDRLTDDVLVELVDVGGDLHAVLASGRGFLHRPLGRTAELVAEVQALRFALHRLVRGHGGPASRAAAVRSARACAEVLDRTIFGPLRHRLGSAGLVLVPVGALHATPWSLLPSCRSRAVTVVPSATAWLAARSRPLSSAPARRPLLVAGPGLPHAAREVRHLAEVLAPVDLLVDADATVEAVRTGMDGVGLVHLAAHGGFRSDNPMFSHLTLTDGPLTVYDLERLPRPPCTVVLSACESGLSSVRPGEELLGLTAALLALGTRTVLASMLPVQDAATLELMLELHRRLAAGQSPAEALAGAQAGLGDQLDERGATAVAFVCLGAG